MIKIGEYVRINGEIAKVIKRDVDNHIVLDIKYRGDTWLTIFEEAIITKHSKNIIDLIEVGDYVNGEIVIKDNLENLVICPTIISNGLYNTAETYKTKIKNIEIKSIVTKEQFKSIEYRLED